MSMAATTALYVLRFFEMKRILFVCHGNICRSPMAELIFKSLIKEEGLEDCFYVESAATSTEELGNPVYPPAARELARHGISSKGKYARQITRLDYNSFDLIIGMDDANIRNMHRIFGGDPDCKIKKLLDYIGTGADVADPWYTGNFDETFRDAYAGCLALLKSLMDSKV